MKTLFALDRPIFFHKRKEKRIEEKRREKSDASLPSLSLLYWVIQYSLLRALITEASMMETNRNRFVSQGVMSSFSESFRVTTFYCSESLIIFQKQLTYRKTNIAIGTST